MTIKTKVKEMGIHKRGNVAEHVEAIERCAAEEECVLEAADRLTEALTGMMSSASKGGLEMKRRIQAAISLAELRKRANEQRKSIEEHLQAIEALKRRKFTRLYGDAPPISALAKRQCHDAVMVHVPPPPMTRALAKREFRGVVHVTQRGVVV